eukprot:627056-Pelagomonas_calceolata.AAC.1
MLLKAYGAAQVAGSVEKRCGSESAGHFCKLANCQSLLAVPLDHNVRAPDRLPRHMHLDLSQHVMRNVSRFRLRAHTLKVETAAWDTRNAFLCDRCSCDEIQDEAHALL